MNNDGHETGTKLVLFSVKIPFYQEDREDRDTAVPVTQCNELCIVTKYIVKALFASCPASLSRKAFTQSFIAT